MCLLIGGIQFLRGYSIQRNVAEENQEIQLLKIEKERLLQERGTAVERSDVGTREKLIHHFDKATEWSILLKELTSQIPPSVWLLSFKAYQEKGTDPKSSKNGLLLTGRAREASDVAVLVQSLSHSHLFNRVILTSSQYEQEENNVYYSFSIDIYLKENTTGNMK